MRRCSRGNPQAVDQTLLQRGWAVEEPYKLSWWDGLVAAAAQSQACAVLLSEDPQDGCTYGTLTVLNPSKSGIAESSARYEATSVTVRRYRSRGRPKRSAVAEVAGERGGAGRSQRTAGSDESSPTPIGHCQLRQSAPLRSSPVSSRPRPGGRRLIPRARDREWPGVRASHDPRICPICCHRAPMLLKLTGKRGA